ncbi:MAG: hypothetical protein PVG78_08295 [Desulfobacterales bacterium]|jgi:hypothetical protein
MAHLEPLAGPFFSVGTTPVVPRIACSAAIFAEPGDNQERFDPEMSGGSRNPSRLVTLRKARPLQQARASRIADFE